MEMSNIQFLMSNEGIRITIFDVAVRLHHCPAEPDPALPEKLDIRN